MTIRPIIFSAEMVRALLDGRKTQTRRLATSPLRRCEPGDLLYVRETWRPNHSGDRRRGAQYRADKPANWRDQTVFKPSIHMPRWASRLTLRVTEVRTQRLHGIASSDTVNEGVQCDTCDAMQRSACSSSGCFASRHEFIKLWNSLHTKPGERWEDNPQIVALTFEVIHGNVDEIARAG